MSNLAVVVIGGSAGGIGAASTLLGGLPTEFAACVVVALHTSPKPDSTLADVLQRASALPVGYGHDGDRLTAGRVFIAPPDRHLLIHDGELVLSRGPRVNRVRPAVDPLFRSAARWWAARVVGVVLSGSLDDGAAGLAAIVRRGGRALVQERAPFEGMPAAATAAVPSALRVPVDELGPALVKLVGALPEDDQRDDRVDDDLLVETDLAETDDGHATRVIGQASAVACPDCRGGMAYVSTAGTGYYRCHVGHAFSPETLLEAQADNVEAALWTAVSILEEKAAVHERLAARHATDSARQGVHHAAERRTRAAATAVRRLLGPASVADEVQAVN